MHIFNTFKSYLFEYALVNKVRISVFAFKKQELLFTKWPCFINLLRIQIVVGIIQLLVNFLLFEIQGNHQTLILDIGIAVAQNILDKCLFIRISENKKFVIIVLLNISHCAYLTTVSQYIKRTECDGEQIYYLELIYRLMLCVVLVSTQPLLSCKILIFVSYYVFICRFLSSWSRNFNEFLIILMIFILYTILEEKKFRKLIQNSIIPNQIINALPLPVFLIKLQTLEIIAHNQQFQQLVQIELGNEVPIKQIEQLLSKFKSLPNQELFNLGSEQMNLYNAIQMIKIKSVAENSRNSIFNHSFSTDENQVFNIQFQSGIEFNNNQCVLISISDISLIIERTKTIERTAFKCQLLKSLSHELRTRKNIIQGLLKLYLDQNEKQQDLIYQAYNNSKIEANIISSIINYNLCIENQVIVNYSVISVNELLSKVIDDFQFEAKQKQINIIYPQNDFPLYTDSDIFQQIITNILSNSIKHCDKVNQSKITISITKEQLTKTDLTSNNYKHDKQKISNYSSFQSISESPDIVDNNHSTLETALIIKIIDNGSGINEKKLHLIKEILNNDNYFQFTCGSDGFFLGLRSCNLLLQRLNKKNKLFLSIQSKENEGTELILHFLVHNDYDISVEDCIQQVRFAKKFKSVNCECMKTILIVDDEPFNNIILEQILLQMGYKVKKANNGQEALKMYRQQEQFCKNQDCSLFLSIFMDYQMPIMNGLESTKAIIEESRKINRPQTNIIGCTAFSSKEDIDELLHAGMKYVCIKPISKDSIKQSLLF